MLWSLLGASITLSDFPHLFQPNHAAQNSQQRPACQGFYLAKIWPKEMGTSIPLSIPDTPRIHWPLSHLDHCVGFSSFQDLNSCLDPIATLIWASHNHWKWFLEVPFGMALDKLHPVPFERKSTPSQLVATADRLLHQPPLPLYNSACAFGASTNRSWGAS